MNEELEALKSAVLAVHDTPVPTKDSITEDELGTLEALVTILKAKIKRVSDVIADVAAEIAQRILEEHRASQPQGPTLFDDHVAILKNLWAEEKRPEVAWSVNGDETKSFKCVPDNVTDDGIVFDNATYAWDAITVSAVTLKEGETSGQEEAQPQG